MTEDQTITRTRFDIGAEAPSWLLDAEPISTQSVPGKFTFMVACDVLDLTDYYVVLPLTYGPIPGPIPGVIQFDGEGCKILATSKPVRLILVQQTLETSEIDAWTPNKYPLPMVQRSFWSKLVDLFR